MHITRVYIDGFKRLTDFELELNSSLNVIVGDNETGKSSVLEAIGLVLTGLYDGRLIQYAIDPYLFNVATVAEYFQKRRNGENLSEPKILIEAYLQSDDEDPELARLEGGNNSKSEKCPGLKLMIEVNSDHIEQLKDYAADETNPEVLPVEFYTVAWRSFADNPVAIAKLPFRTTTIDTSLPRIYRGPNKYLLQVTKDVLTEGQRQQLALAYRKLRHKFTEEEGVEKINRFLEKEGNPATKKKLSIQMDMSSRSSWENSITAHLDDLPFDLAGKGEQCLVQMRLAIIAKEQSKVEVVLIEEPENHLSHSNLNMLMDDIQKDCAGQQVIVTTHSAFVLNKLGIDNLHLLSLDGSAMTIKDLTASTRDYFLKLPGYDTLRLILSKRSILVEGPSDELIVQRAYKDKHEKLPLADGVDVISVNGRAFLRFLEIARLLKLQVRAVTDNDGKVAALKKKYADYINGEDSTIRICFDDKNLDRPTLEPQLLMANSLGKLNKILGKKCVDDEALLKYMDANKTDCALKMFLTPEQWTTPEYIANAIE